MTILLFNNQIYGLTKGQYSPTSEVGKVTKSTPMGSVDHPFNPVSLALGAEATFVARTMDSDRKHLTGILKAAAAHRGTALVEIYQNCPIFNDGAFDLLKDRSQQEARHRAPADGEPVQVGPRGRPQVARPRRRRRDRVRPRGRGRRRRGSCVHDAHADDPSPGLRALAARHPQMTHVPMGIFRNVARPTYDDLVRAQVEAAVDTAGGPATDADLDALLHGRDTWTVG